MRSRRSLRERTRFAGCTAGLAAAIGALAAAGGAASAAVALAAHSSGAARPAASQGLDVLPFPGTPDAAPGTNVDFPAVSPALMGTVTVVGSRSGLHPGRLSAQPAGQGTAFMPDRPFSPGERVSVIATFRSAKAGTRSSAPGATRVSFSFSVARPAGSTTWAGPGAPGGDALGSVGGSEASSSKTHSFVTHPGFQMPWVRMSGRDPDPGSGDIVLNAEHSAQNAVYILNPRGALLWYRPMPSQPSHLLTHVVRVQHYHGQPVLTYWRGTGTQPPGGGRGVDLMLNKHYKTIHTVTAGDGYESQGADSHEFFLGHEGSEATAFISIWSPVQANLTSVGGPPNGATFDWIIQEIDIATNKVIWEWHSLNHVPIRDSYERYVPGVGYDYFHLNSIQQLPSGRILISARHTWAVYSIEKNSGKIAWELGGKHSSFTMGRGTRFFWQHDATLHGGGLLTLFDDGAPPREEPQSRALFIHLGNHHATLVHAYTHKRSTLATSEGSVQILPNHNVFVGWGNQPYFSEYAPGGRQLFGGSFFSPIHSYRAYRAHWTGHPPWAPTIAVRPAKTAGQDLVYASWNGSTQVRQWQVLSSSSAAGPFVKVGARVPWTSFETKMQRPKANYFEVEALGARGHVLGTSAAAAGP